MIQHEDPSPTATGEPGAQSGSGSGLESESESGGITAGEDYQLDPSALQVLPSA
jgi:hypothetical protein